MVPFIYVFPVWEMMSAFFVFFIFKVSFSSHTVVEVGAGEERGKKTGGEF